MTLQPHDATRTNDQDLMIRELNHRIANDLSSAISALEVCKLRVIDTEVCEYVEMAIQRLRACGRGQQMLSVAPEGAKTALAHFLTALLDDTFKQRIVDANVSLSLEADDILVPSEPARRVGMIVKELVTNSLKHAFGPAGGHIQVSLRYTGATLVLKVSDRAEGPRAPARRGSGQGTSLVDEIAATMGGSVRRRATDRGYSVKMTIALSERQSVH